MFAPARGGAGGSLAVGDVNRDGRIDLVAFGVVNGGAGPIVGSFCPGRAAGPMRCRRMRGGAPTEAGFPPGSLAVGDVTGDGFPDILLGDPIGNSIAAHQDVPPGELLLWRGTRRGPARRPVVITENTRGVPGRSRRGDRFGAAVAVGRLDGDRYADIVVGVPGQDRSAGRVTVIRGARSGHALTGNRTLQRGVNGGLPGARHTKQALGSTIALLDLDGDHRLDLIAGAPGVVADVDDPFPRRPSLIVARGSGHRGRPFPISTARSFGFAALGLTDQTMEPAGTLGSTLGRVGSS